MFHYDQFRSGATLASAPGTANQMWRFATGSFVYSSPAVSDGLVFVNSYDTNVYAIDEYSGQQKWSFYTGSVIFSSPAVANGMVYVASRNGGILYALNEQTGSEVWGRGYLNYFIAASPAGADGKVFYSSWCSASCFQNGQFVALDASTGAVVWANATLPSSSVSSSPAVHNGRVFFGLDDGSVTALNETTGKAIWRVVPGGAVTIRNAPAIAYGRVYVGTATKFFALDEITGATDWSFNTGNSNSTSAAVSNGVVYFGTGKGNVYAVNATTGVQKWVATTGASVSSSPALSLGSNMVLAGSNDHYLYALNATSGVRLWRYLTSAPIWSSPAVADGRVFFGSNDYNVYALGVVAPKLQATVFPSVTSLKPGQISTLTITVTNGSAPQIGVTLALTSSAGGGFTQPVPGSPGLYYSNFTAPLVSSTTGTIIQVVASETGFLSGSAQTTITVNPFPPLTVATAASPTSITPGGEIVLEIRVTNGTSPVMGATILLSSSAGGAFSAPTVGGHRWELGPVPIPNTEVNLPCDLCGSVVRKPTRSLDRCQPHFLSRERAVSFLDIFRISLSYCCSVLGINVYNVQTGILSIFRGPIIAACNSPRERYLQLAAEQLGHNQSIALYCSFHRAVLRFRPEIANAPVSLGYRQGVAEIGHVPELREGSNTQDSQGNRKTLN